MNKLIIDTKPDHSGFWYNIRSSQKSKYSFEYFVIGNEGHQTSGEITGLTDSGGGWQYYKIGFDTLKIGISNINITSIEMLQGEEKTLTNNSKNEFVKMSDGNFDMEMIEFFEEAPGYYPTYY